MGILTGETEMNNVKEGVTISAGLTAPAWLPILNEWVGCLIGIATLIYMCIKICLLLFRSENIK
ncbi:MAG: hypothetical protein IKR09_09360 [Alphaproteobacteria bacterium]|nr:hypothetical protein [Alphaproteobacteria bacterium]